MDRSGQSEKTIPSGTSCKMSLLVVGPSIKHTSLATLLMVLVDLQALDDTHPYIKKGIEEHIAWLGLKQTISEMNIKRGRGQDQRIRFA